MVVNHLLITVCSDIVVIFLDRMEEAIAVERQGALKGLQKQAGRMLVNSNNRFPPVNVGTTVIVPVPSVDRAKGDHRNVLGTVMSTPYPGMYQLGTRDGTITHLFARNQFEPTRTNFLTPAEVPSKKTTVRSTAIAASPAGGQGFKRCHCTMGCDSNRCSCKRGSLNCNSKCHPGRSCKNCPSDK
jgi:hypothetical protein